VESLFVFFFLRDSDLQKNDDMSRAYFILLNVLLVINYAFDKRTIIGIAFSVIGTLFLVSMGTRGPVIIALSFTAVKIVLSSVSKGHGFLAIVAILALIWFVNSDYWNAFLYYLQGVLESLGLSTRVIELAIQGETLTYYSERDEIAQLVISKIKERPLMGWGVYGEWQFVGWSAHNMYLEILDHYGVILGGFIIIWMLFINVKAFLSSKVPSVRNLVVLFACFALVRGVFGGGFLTFPTFLTLGYCLQVCRKTNFNYVTT
jgi:O-antigen ligase